MLYTIGTEPVKVAGAEHLNAPGRGSLMQPLRSNTFGRSALLAALHPARESFESALREHAAGIDWEWLIERATAHKVVALLASRVIASGLGSLMPATVVARMAEARAQAIARNAAALNTLQEAAQCLDEAGVSFMVVKGSVLTERVYDDAGQRQFFDLDLVVRMEQIDAAEAALTRLGYRLWGADRFLGVRLASAAELAVGNAVMRQSLLQFSHELSLVAADQTILPIDLHWHLAPPGRLRITPAQLWDYTTMSRVGETTVRVLDPESTLVHLAVHALSNRPWNFRLLHLVDVAWALHHLSLDRDRLWTVARSWGAEMDLARAAVTVRRALGASLPAHLQLEARTIPWQRSLIRVTTPEALTERRAAEAPARWVRVREDIDWALAMGSLRSTTILLIGKYVALIRFVARRLLLRRSGQLS